MKFQFCLAAAMVLVSGMAQASTNFPSILSEGVNTIDISLAGAGDTLFQEDVLFTLGKTSQVTGTLSSVNGAVTLLGVRAQRFSEMGNSPIIQVTPVDVGGSSTFDLGKLMAPTGIGFESGLYTLSLSGLTAAGETGLRLSLNVSSIPEPATWGMLALGMVGVAGVRRAKSQGATAA
jgi:hypothetical protein